MLPIKKCPVSQELYGTAVWVPDTPKMREVWRTSMSTRAKHGSFESYFRAAEQRCDDINNTVGGL